MTPYEVAVARDFPAFRRMDDQFNAKGYRLGRCIEVDRYSWPKESRFVTRSRIRQGELKVGHFISGIAYCEIGLSDVPEQFRTREFFIHTISDDNVRNYIQAHPKKFNRKFFKDVIATKDNCLTTHGGNIFEWMPLEFIDEEMVMCAMYASMDHWDHSDWLFQVHERKPEVLTREIFIIAAKEFGAGTDFAKRLKKITPRKYRTSEFYAALCHGGRTGVMGVVPKSIVTNKFLSKLYLGNPKSIECFTEEALEREVTTGKYGTVKFWQLAILDDGELIRNIPLNDERNEFFMAHYDKDSFEYEYYFKERYKAYLREKNGTSRRNNDSTKVPGLMMLAIAMSGGSINEAADVGNKIATGSVDREAQLPIKYRDRVPQEYCKKFDKEEYLLEIYKKLGIEVLGEADAYYYDVILPEGFSVEHNGDYFLKRGDEMLLRYRDIGPFWDRDVDVIGTAVTL